MPRPQHIDPDDFRPDPPDSLPPEAVITHVPETTHRCKFCAAPSTFWVTIPQSETVTYSQTWCGLHVTEVAGHTPMTDGTPPDGTAQAQTFERFLAEKIERAPNARITSSALYDLYVDYGEAEGVRVGPHGTFVGRMVRWGHVELEWRDGDASGALDDLLLRGVVPA